MGLLDILFETETPVHERNSLKKNDPYHRNCMEEDYYEDTYCDAMSGDREAISEMRDEFGDDWESEF